MKLRIAETDEDFSRISRFRKTFAYHGSDSIRRSMEPEYYRWKCGGTPGTGRGFLFFMEENDRILATISVCPKPVTIRGRLVRGAELCDGFTDPDYQRRGLFTGLVKESCQEAERQGIELIYGTPDVRTSLAPLVRKCNFGEVQNTRIRYAVRFVHARHVAGGLRPRWLTPPVTLGLRLVAGSINLPWTLLGRKYRMTNDELHPDRLVAFAASCQPATPFTGLIRHEEYLRWRYLQNPDRYQFIALLNGDESVAGVAVWKPGYKGDTRIHYLADLFISPTAGFDAMIRLLLASRTVAATDDADISAMWNPVPGKGRGILPWLMGFVPYRRIPLIVHKNQLVSELRVLDHTWDLSMGDTDNI